MMCLTNGSQLSSLFSNPMQFTVELQKNRDREKVTWEFGIWGDLGPLKHIQQACFYRVIQSVFMVSFQSLMHHVVNETGP